MRTAQIVTCGIFCGLTTLTSALRAAPDAPAPPLNYGRSITALLGGKKADRSQVMLRVEKSKFLLTLFYRGRALKSYPVVLGRDPVHDKLCEGDGCTPEGQFKVVEIRLPHRWSKFLLLNYPTAASRKHFSEAVRSGRLPRTAGIGGTIGIHGVPKGCDSAIDVRQNWTAGCISLKTRDINEIAGVCRRGTPVKIE